MSKGCAVVVGAGTGTGSEVAKRFAEGGYSVALARRNAEALAPLVAEIEATGGKAGIGGLEDASAILAGDAGTLIAGGATEAVYWD